jgi:hypothetical protein
MRRHEKPKKWNMKTRRKAIVNNGQVLPELQGFEWGEGVCDTGPRPG